MLKGHWRLLLRVLPTRSSDPALSSARNIAARCSSSSTQTYTLTGNKQRGIWKKVAWTGAAALVGGGAYVGYILTPDWRQITDSRHYYSDWKLRAYFSLPLNALSMVAGGVASCQVPTFLRHPLYSSFASVYGVDMGEAAEEDLTKYPTFASFFNRSLKEGVRPISSSPLVSPADGVVLHFGKIEEDRVEYVKGHDYDFKDFCGPVNSERQPDMDLYQLVIYLAPGDYHGFHSPTRWVASQAVHQPGLLLSVRPWVLERVPHLLCLNERIVINGTWRHGFFSMAAVAATNVGDIAIDADPLLRTNVSRRAHNGERRVTELHHPYTVGERVGEFRLGSTIVLVFEGPPTLRWAINAGDKLRYGQSLILS